MSSSSSSCQDVKPDWAVLEGRKKPDQAEADDGAADIKPVIPGLEKQGIDFVKIRAEDDYVWRADEIRIKLLGTKEGVNYELGLIVYPLTTVLTIKEYLCRYYGYEVAKLRLLYDGQILSDPEIMRKLEVENGDTFDVYLEQLGG